ncbi:MAG: hypothetical protein KC445_03210 [Anaerolineales bacterium]|nr:hypothetical protein [Anaerolineales bacterium]
MNNVRGIRRGALLGLFLLLGALMFGGGTAVHAQARPPNNVATPPPANRITVVVMGIWAATCASIRW